MDEWMDGWINRVASIPPIPVIPVFVPGTVLKMLPLVTIYKLFQSDNGITDMRHKR